MLHLRFSTAALLTFLLAGAACKPAFLPARFTDNQALFDASRREYDRKHWDNAQAGFERLTLNLPARHPLLPKSFFWLGKTHNRKHQYLLAAQNFTRVTESFPDDSLGDDALIEAGGAYANLWRKPPLDATYGQTAIATYRTLLALYPNSDLRATAEREIRELQEWLATKDFETGMHYFRRKAYDSAIIYFRDVVKNYPETPAARLAQLRMVEAFRNPAMRYFEDANEVCAALRQAYPDDREVREECGAPTGTANNSTP
jgi:outer membrane protein assembly factor BamD